jgi:DNA-binding GntR family transcriptional regulator
MKELITSEEPKSAQPASRKTESLTAIVREQIEQKIFNGEFKAGERLIENTLATNLNVSRGPIREATRQLAEAGLLTIIKNRGVFVRKVSLEEVLNLYDVRSGLARVAGRLAALRATPEQIEGLWGIWEKMESTRKARQTDDYYELNIRFHAALIEATANPRLIDLHQMTESELHLYTRWGVSGAKRLDQSNLEHQQILECITKGDEWDAAQAIENHVLNGKQRMLDSLGWK